MNILRRYGLPVIILFTVGISAFSIALNSVPFEKPDVLRGGEALTYKVKWTFVRVGTLRLVNEGLVKRKGKEYFKLKIYIDSADGIPFVTIHDTYESYVDSNAVPVAFYAVEDKGDHKLETDYIFDYENKVVKIQVRKNYPDRIIITQNQNVPLDQTYRDVLSLLYYARQMSGTTGSNMTIPTFVLDGRDSCYFHQMGKLDEIKYNGKLEPSYYLEGKIKFIGIAGIKDDFEGWFSVDRQRVPLVAKMKAFFGSITIELENSENWLAADSYK